MSHDSDWYALLIDGEPVSVKRFTHPPAVFDFGVGIHSSSDYEIAPVRLDFEPPRWVYPDDKETP